MLATERWDFEVKQSFIQDDVQREFMLSSESYMTQASLKWLWECSSAALEDVFEALSSGGATEFPLVQPRLTLIQDYSLPLERYDDYEDDEGELRAESNLAEKFG